MIDLYAKAQSPKMKVTPSGLILQNVVTEVRFMYYDQVINNMQLTRHICSRAVYVDDMMSLFRIYDVIDEVLRYYDQFGVLTYRDIKTDMPDDIRVIIAAVMTSTTPFSISDKTFIFHARSILWIYWLDRRELQTIPLMHHACTLLDMNRVFSCYEPNKILVYDFSSEEMQTKHLMLPSQYIITDLVAGLARRFVMIYLRDEEQAYRSIVYKSTSSNTEYNLWVINDQYQSINSMRFPDIQPDRINILIE